MLAPTVNFFLNKFHYLHLGIANPLICISVLNGAFTNMSSPYFSTYIWALSILFFVPNAYLVLCLHNKSTCPQDIFLINIDNDIVLPLGNILAEAENGITWQSWLKKRRKSP